MSELLPDALSGALPAVGQRSTWGRLLCHVSRWVAMTGSLVFVGLVVLSIISIVGRKLFSLPVPGDVEILQMCAAGATAAFFAWCHLTEADLKVDFFTVKASPKARHAMDALGSLLYAVVGSTLCWRAWVGALALREAGETTTVLAWPIWLAQVAMVVPGLLLFALAGWTMAWYHLSQMGEPA